MIDYEAFITKKSTQALHAASLRVSLDELNPKLYRFQKDIVRWALAKGRAAVFADCGLGKTPIQLEWASQIIKTQGGSIGARPRSTGRLRSGRCAPSSWKSGTHAARATIKA